MYAGIVSSKCGASRESNRRVSNAYLQAKLHSAPVYMMMVDRARIEVTALALITGLTDVVHSSHGGGDGDCRDRFHVKWMYALELYCCFVFVFGEIWKV